MITRVSVPVDGSKINGVRADRPWAIRTDVGSSHLTPPCALTGDSQVAGSVTTEHDDKLERWSVVKPAHGGSDAESLNTINLGGFPETLAERAT